MNADPIAHEIASDFDGDNQGSNVFVVGASQIFLMLVVLFVYIKPTWKYVAYVHPQFSGIFYSILLDRVSDKIGSDLVMLSKFWP